MSTLHVHLFKDSFRPFVELLNEQDIKYQMQQVRMGVPMASGGVLEIVQAVGNAAFWPSVATVVVAFINAKRGRKVIITTKDQTVVHAEGLTPSELESVLQQAQSLTAIDTSKDAEPVSPASKEQPAADA